MYNGNWKYAIGQATTCPGAAGVERRVFREGVGQSVSPSIIMPPQRCQLVLLFYFFGMEGSCRSGGEQEGEEGEGVGEVG